MNFTSLYLQTKYARVTSNLFKLDKVRKIFLKREL